MAVAIKAELRDRRRGQILDAAWAIARESGIATVGLREVARRAGMRAPSLYEYFDSKRAIYDAMFAEGYDEFLLLAPSNNDPRPPRRLAVAWLRRYFAFCRTDVARYQLLFQPAVPGFHPSDESMLKAQRALKMLDEFLDRAGITRPGASEIWTALVTGMVNQQVANDPAGNRWERLAEESVEMFFNHYSHEDQG
ncbi:MAG TPA: TetR/AcrR family transcriptional regulator [Chloroflexi bacterium]|jgi:AcrR family transcriptional regulator|nr:TetR/AcrR family transcriptional regulator [Chloroflexota bacterium]